MISIIIALLIGTGAFFMFVAAIGIVRMPDFFMRLSASTKAFTLGASSLLIATALYFNDYAITSQIVAIIVFIVMTAPVAAHMLCRAAYISKVQLWKGTICDELRGRYDLERHVLRSPIKAQEENSGDKSAREGDGIRGK